MHHTGRRTAVEQPFSMPQAVFHWGLMYGAVAKHVRSERDLADLCDALDAAVQWTPVAPPRDATTGERSLSAQVPGLAMTVWYTVGMDVNGYVRCTITQARITGEAVVAA